MHGENLFAAPLQAFRFTFPSVIFEVPCVDHQSVSSEHMIWTGLSPERLQSSGEETIGFVPICPGNHDRKRQNS